MILDATLFLPFEICHRTRFVQLQKRFPTTCSHYNFASLYCWQDEYRTTWQIKDDHLMIHNGSSDILLMPHGPDLSSADLVSLSHSLRSQGMRGCIGLVPPQFLQRHPDLKQVFHFTRDEDNADYIYSTSSLVELKGRKLSRKRNQVHQFLSSHPDHYCRELFPEEWPICSSLASEWSRGRLDLPLEESPESRALQRAFSHCRELDIHGFGLFSARQLVAFSIWSRQTDHMATVHFEKFDPAVRGASHMINRETARFLSSWASWINREQDLGIPGLRRAKRSYLPERILWGYTALPVE